MPSINQSPLGSTSTLYRVKKNETGSILDNPQSGLLELYPAGFTHPSRRDNRNRQRTYQGLYEMAVALGTEDENRPYPFGKDTHELELIHDPTNEFDDNKAAIHVILRAKEGSPLHALDGMDLGFVPKKINKQLLKNLTMINGGRILKVRAEFHKKYYTAKVVFAYGENRFHTAKNKMINRFSALLDEV